MKKAIREKMIRNIRKPMICHLYLPQMIWRRALNGDVNQGNEVGGRLGRNTTFVIQQYSNGTMKVQDSLVTVQFSRLRLAFSSDTSTSEDSRISIYTKNEHTCSYVALARINRGINTKRMNSFVFLEAMTWSFANVCPQTH